MSYLGPEDENTEEKEESAEEMLGGEDSTDDSKDDDKDDDNKDGSSDNDDNSDDSDDKDKDDDNKDSSDDEDKGDSSDDDNKDDDNKDDDNKDDDKDSDDDKENKDDEEEEPKDLSEEEIEKLPKDAKGLYYAYKKEKGKRQTLEATEEKRKIHSKYHKDDKPKEGEKEDEKPPERDFETEEDILKDKEDDDLVSVGEQKRITEARKNEATYQKKITDNEASKVSTKQQKEIDRMDALEDSFKKENPDYDEYLNIFQQAKADMPSSVLEIVAEAKKPDGNPAQKAYEIGKRFKGAYAAKKVDTDTGKPNKKKTDKDIKKIIKNADKKPSSSSLPGSEVTNEALDEMDIEDLGKHLDSLSMNQFMKVPRKIRNKVLG